MKTPVWLDCDPGRCSDILLLLSSLLIIDYYYYYYYYLTLALKDGK